MTKDTEALREALKDLARGVFIDAATITHHSWVDGTNGREPDFDEYAGDYAESFADAYVDNITAALATPASDVAPVEYETLIAAGFDEYAAHCALRTEPDGGFCHAYFYSDGQWRFQTGGNDLTLADGTILRCVLTKRLFAHPPLAQSVDPDTASCARSLIAQALHGETNAISRAIVDDDDRVFIEMDDVEALLVGVLQSVDPAGGEALREVAAKYADMGIDERAEAMADNCDGDPWELIGYFREKLRQSQARVDAANNAATGFAKKLAALKGPAA